MLSINSSHSTGHYDDMRRSPCIAKCSFNIYLHISLELMRCEAVAVPPPTTTRRRVQHITHRSRTAKSQKNICRIRKFKADNINADCNNLKFIIYICPVLVVLHRMHGTRRDNNIYEYTNQESIKIVCVCKSSLRGYMLYIKYIRIHYIYCAYNLHIYLLPIFR